MPVYKPRISCSRARFHLPQSCTRAVFPAYNCEYWASLSSAWDPLVTSLIDEHACIPRSGHGLTFLWCLAMFSASLATLQQERIAGKS